MEKHLHIVTLNVPFPVDYGGLYDLFYKLPSLQIEGVKIHLHCFEYGKGIQTELNKYCQSVSYYPRQSGHKAISNHLPYIVASRRNDQLLENLLKDDYPIMMEGVHCTFLLNDNRFDGRRKFVRIHNVEYQYYSQLAHWALSPFKKLYYGWESRLLRKYEQSIVSKATAFWGVSEKDVETYRKELGCKTIDYLPVYLPPKWQESYPCGMGHFCLYQADLSVDVNEKAVIWLLKEVLVHFKIPFVIAGKNPSNKLKMIAGSRKHTCIVANPTCDVMNDMIAKAHIHILPSFHSCGIKLKLVNALYNGRHCIVNDATVEGTPFGPICHVANSKEEFIERIGALLKIPFSREEFQKRTLLLKNVFSNERNARQQVEWIFGN